MNKYMDRTELAIAGISDAELIKYYIMPDGVMGLLIIKGSTVHNMSAGEKHFDSLEQAAVRAYAACPDAAADDFTRKILSGRSGADISPLSGQYEGAEGVYEKTLPFEKDTVRAFQGLMEYYLEMIYEKLGEKIVFPAELSGYRRNYSLRFRLNGERKIIPFSFAERGSCFEFVFGNVIEATDSIRLSVKYSFGIISVSASVKCKKQMRIENSFDIFNKTEKLRIFDENEIVYNGSKAVPSVVGDIPKTVERICTCNEYEILRLPFGKVYSAASDNKTEIIAAQKNPDGGAVFLYQAVQGFLSDDKKIVTDSMEAVHEFFSNDGKIKLCTHFLPTAFFSRGIYKRELENRYFYRSFDDMGGEENGG